MAIQSHSNLLMVRAECLSKFPLSPLLNLFIPWNLAKCVLRAVFQLKGPTGKAPLYSQQTHIHMQDVLSTTHITHQVEGK